MNGLTLFVGLFLGALGETPLEVWPNGVVRYKISPGFISTEYVLTIKNAMKEYQDKTCLTFQPLQPDEIPFTSYTVISYDSKTLCTTSSKCTPGANFITFGLQCNTNSTGVHELGRNLCLEYEHTRPDRDDHLTYDPDCEENKRAQKNSQPIQGFYDIQSAMHYACDPCLVGTPKHLRLTRCGPSITPGLSLLDVDKINANFNCQGCRRHRWRQLLQLTVDDRKNMFSFGYADLTGESLYPCRVLSNGTVIVGKYIASKRTCFVPGEQSEFMENVEVLTIPGGLSQHGYTYQVVDVNKINVLSAVTAGHFAQSTTQTYIAFATVFTSEGHIEEAIGEVDLYKTNPKAKFFVNGAQSAQSCFSVLICHQ